MSYFKKLRKTIKNTLIFNIIQNYLHNPLKTYSDCFGEDLFVNNYFSEVDKGFYIDIGCNQPKINSLTYSLYKKGWNGLNCDISERCIQLYRFFRERDINLNIAVGKIEKQVKSFIFYVQSQYKLLLILIYLFLKGYPFSLTRIYSRSSS